MGIRAIITGATGMVGEGVLHECLLHPEVESVLVINRRPGGVVHPKLTEIVHKDFFNLAPIADQLRGYDTCFFCAGVSSVGIDEPEYTRLTYDLTMHMATTLLHLNPQSIFCYVSGAGTDGSEKGRFMWARVKGRTENHLMQMPFKHVYVFRPGYLQPTKGLKNTKGFYGLISWLYPLLHLVFANSTSTLRQLGLAMITVVLKGNDKHVIEVRDINALAKA